MHPLEIKMCVLELPATTWGDWGTGDHGKNGLTTAGGCSAVPVE